MKPIYKTNLKNNIFNQIDKSEIISFDIFDTLLLRPFIHPFDVLGYLEFFFDIQGFKDARLQAEPLARLNYLEKCEITIKNIYEFVPERFKFVEEHEQNFELSILQANKEMTEIFNYAKEHDKRIIIMSDMYLPKEILKQALIKNGFEGYESIFVSSDIGCRKSDGSLFDYVIKYLNIPANKILHIGDNFISDYKIPKKLGLNAFHYRSIINDFFAKDNHWKFKEIYERKSLNKSILSLFIGMQIINDHNNQGASYWENLGYSLGGIFIYSYVKFIVDNLIKTSASDCLFVARDGYMLSKVFSLFKEAENIKNHYIYAPRMVTILGLCHGLDNIDYVKYFRDNIGEHFPQYQDLIESANTLDKLLEKDEIKQYCSSILDEYKKYLQTINIAGDKVYLVDLGSNSGSSQKLLTSLFKDKFVAGFYFTLNKNLKVPHFVYDNSNIHLIFEEFMEFLITSPDTTVVNFNNGKPILKEAEINDQKNSLSIRLLQKGELGFCKDIKSILGNFEKNFPPDIIKEYMNLFFEYTTKSDIEHMKEIFWFYTPEHKISVSFYDILKRKYRIFKKQKIKLKIINLFKFIKNIIED